MEGVGKGEEGVTVLEAKEREKRRKSGEAAYLPARIMLDAISAIAYATVCV